MREEAVYRDASKIRKVKIVLNEKKARFNQQMRIYICDGMPDEGSLGRIEDVCRSQLSFYSPYLKLTLGFGDLNAGLKSDTS